MLDVRYKLIVCCKLSLLYLLIDFASSLLLFNLTAKELEFFLVTGSFLSFLFAAHYS